MCSLRRDAVANDGGSRRRIGLVLLCAVTLAWLPHTGSGDDWLIAIGKRDTRALAVALDRQGDVDRSGDDGKTALMVAAGAGDLGLLERLIAAGADVNRRNRGAGTALMFAAQYGETACAERLIAAGADVNLIGAKGFTALMIAVLKGRQSIMELLLSAGADPNLVDMHGWTPLQRAVATQRLDLVRQLLAHNEINVDHRNSDGVTALHLAAAGGQLESVQALLQRGADRKLHDARGNTALSLAVDAGHTAVATVLRQ